MGGRDATARKSRTANAIVTAFFTYGQFGLSLLAAFVVTPLILRRIGTREYGLWLSTGELVSYILLLDFGVFSVLPWLIARSDGEKRPEEIKRHLVHGLCVGISLSTILLIAVITCDVALPRVFHLTPADWRTLRSPFFVLAVLVALSLPGNTFNALLTGLQDVRFTGVTNLARGIVGPTVTLALLLQGYGLYALAIGAAALSPMIGTLSFLRGRAIAPDLLRQWPRPSLSGVTKLLRESVGGWLGSAGVQLMERSSAVVLSYIQLPAVVPVLVCTSRLGQALTQMAWVMPDSALVGFAQLGGEKKNKRLQEVALTIIKLNLVLAGLAACMVLVINPMFVRLWVGQAFFGGLILNYLLAVEVLNASVTHSLANIVAVQGHRLAIGLATVGQGLIYILLAVTLSRKFLLQGLIVADLIAPLFSTIPVALVLLRSAAHLSFARLSAEIVPMLFFKLVPCLMVAACYGSWRAAARLPEVAATGLALTAIYIRCFSVEIAAFPLPTRGRIWLERAYLIGRAPIA